jgi:hypothetical protein
VAVPTVERDVFVGFFCSIATAGREPLDAVDVGFSMRSRNWRAYAESDST